MDQTDPWQVVAREVFTPYDCLLISVAFQTDPWQVVPRQAFTPYSCLVISTVC